MALTIDAGADTLNRYAATYARNIQQTLRQGLEFEQRLTPRACDNTYSAPNATVTEIIQQEFVAEFGSTFKISIPNILVCKFAFDNIQTMEIKY